MKKRYSFAYLTSLFTNQMGRELYLGMKEALQDKEVDLTVFVGGALQGKETLCSDLADNTAYELAQKGDFDGIIIYGGAIGQLISKEEVEAFCNSFSPIPVVNISLQLPNIPSVVISNYQGMYKLTEHLISAHDCNNFAFIKGPETHEEAEQRFNAFHDALADNQISINEEFILPGNFSMEAGVAAVAELMKKPKSCLPDAIVCVDDDTALGVINALKEQKISVPSEIIVTGFDDARFAKNCVPSITSVQQPFQKLGQTAALQLFEKVNGNPIAQLIEVESLPVIHESCGCYGHQQFPFIARTENEENDDNMFIDSMIGSYQENLTINSLLLMQLLSSLEKVCNGETEVVFYNAFSLFMDNQSAPQEKIPFILNLLANLKNHVQHKFEERLLNAIFQQAALNAHSIIQRTSALAQYQTEENYNQLNFVNQKLHQATSLKQFYEMSHKLLGSQYINRCAILLYQERGKKLDNLRMTFSYNQQQLSIPSEASPICLTSIFDDFFQRGKSNAIVMPLTLSREKIGIVLLDLNNDILDLSQTLSWHFSSILKRLQTISENEQKRGQLESTLQDLQKTQQRLIETEKLAALGKLVADVAHEMNTPLGVSITYSSLIVDTTEKIEQLINNGPVKKSELNAQLALLNKAGKANLVNLGRSSDLVNSFKNLAIEHDPTQLRTLFIKETIEDAIVPMRNRLNKAHHQVTINSPSKLVAYSYPRSLVQVLMAFIDNSLCHAYKLDERGCITISAEQDEEQIMIIYEDDGCGISDHDRNHILEPFFTTKRNQGHVGLGLTTIHNIVRKNLHGKLKICNVAQGTRIQLSFPVDIKKALSTDQDIN
ncbi:substrate-binding domain-containing protein [Psychromonas sp. psych-6C06]|uniref:substrate-binding domain-containing protein n=1 Tax=Psychromonas sp. psych-6C06 TaxID=2058089 RepID=UPI00187CE7B2|nr:substrate-binding domain-containing protein [Psychromonas sp. psych-6C06]